MLCLASTPFAVRYFRTAHHISEAGIHVDENGRYENSRDGPPPGHAVEMGIF
jgi:hypothetical protein